MKLRFDLSDNEEQLLRDGRLLYLLRVSPLKVFNDSIGKDAVLFKDDKPVAYAKIANAFRIFEDELTVDILVRSDFQRKRLLHPQTKIFDDYPIRISVYEISDIKII